MTLPESAYLNFTADLRICRILGGMWQVSGAHGSIRPQDAIRDMRLYHEAGFTTWDLADHYGPAEDFIGEFHRSMTTQHGIDYRTQIQALTKWVPRPGTVTLSEVKQAINTSLRRMGVPVLDLLQFHWWQYDDYSYMDALSMLADLRGTGLIRHLALTNFDTERLQLITERGIRIVSNQVQYSLIDRRPEVMMTEYSKSNGIWLLPYGVLCGGFLSAKYLGQPDPKTYSLPTASLQKYKRMIDAWGGWGLFQSLLRVLSIVADKHHVSISNIATRYILDKPMVAGVIIGVRLGLSEHRDETCKVFQIKLDEEDLGMIQAIQTQSRDLFRVIGDCGSEYRN